MVSKYMHVICGLFAFCILCHGAKQQMSLGVWLIGQLSQLLDKGVVGPLEGAQASSLNQRDC